jgi:predicted Rossmann fold nucleotide-binding protein DprA/Smf involved in DNA uptake
MKRYIYATTVMFFVAVKILSAQNHTSKTNEMHANGQKILQMVSNLELFQWTDENSMVYKYGPSVQGFYKQLTINGQMPDSLSCNDMAGIALVALKALAEKSEELSNNQRLIEESVQRLNQATEDAAETGQIVNQLQTKITDLENKLMNLEFQFKEMESNMKH